MNAEPTSALAVAYDAAAVAALFTDPAWLAALLRTEVALARAQARVGVIPAASAAAITDRAATFLPDWAKLKSATERDGFPIIGLVDQLRDHIGEAAAAHVHWGATTQDILDTALVCQIRDGLGLIEKQLIAVCGKLAALADRHRQTVCIGRTHLQWAVPATFGLKAASWLAPLLRQQQRLRELRPRVLVVQCGGAAGTLASFGSHGPKVAQEWAAELALRVPSMPWHTQRDSIQELADWLALLTTMLAKFGHDVLLLTQSEIAEVRESAEPAGGSSAMPQKRNPVLCERLLVAANEVRSHRDALASAPLPEHERGTLTMQLEWQHLPRLMALTAGCLVSARRLAKELVVDVERMKTNLDSTHGVLLAEAAAIALSEQMPPADAKQFVAEASEIALAEKRHLIDVLRERTEVAVDWESLRNESNYLGSTQTFIDAVLAQADAMLHKNEAATT